MQANNLRTLPKQTEHHRACTSHRRRHTCRALLQGLFGRGSSQQQGSFADASERTQEWYRAAGLEPGPLSLADCGVEGKGLAASTRIRKGQTVVTVPASMVVTAEVARSCSTLQPLLNDQTSLPTWSLLALFLAELRHWGTSTEETSQAGASSPSLEARAVPPSIAQWLPYLDALPLKPGTVLAWTEQQVQSLQGSPLLSKVQSIRQGVAASYAQLLPIIAQAEQDGLVPAGALSRDNIYWAFEMLLSRCVRLSNKDNEEALVPWADFLNHSPEVDAHLDWDPSANSGKGAVVLQVDRDYQPGQQVYISYGARTAGQLLLSYGFCPPPSTHPHEAYLLQLGLKKGDPLFALKQQALSKRGCSEDEIEALEWPLRLEGLPAGLVAWAAFRAVGSAKDSEAEVESLASQLFGSSGPLTAGSKGLPPELEALGLQELGAVCSVLLKGYPTSKEQDRAAAAQGGSQTAASRAQELQQGLAAIRVVERQILARTQYIASSRASELRKAAKRR